MNQTNIFLEQNLSQYLNSYQTKEKKCVIILTKHRQKYDQRPFRIRKNGNIHQTNASNQNIVKNIHLNPILGHRKY